MAEVCYEKHTNGKGNHLLGDSKPVLAMVDMEGWHPAICIFLIISTIEKEWFRTPLKNRRFGTGRFVIA